MQGSGAGTTCDPLSKQQQGTVGGNTGLITDREVGVLRCAEIVDGSALASDSARTSLANLLSIDVGHPDQCLGVDVLPVEMMNTLWGGKSLRTDAGQASNGSVSLAIDVIGGHRWRTSLQPPIGE